MKIFELKRYFDGGPNDWGTITGYIKANSKEELNLKGWEDAFEISEEKFLKKKKEAWEHYKMYKDI